MKGRCVMTQKNKEPKTADIATKDSYPDAHGRIQNHPDARGFKPGEDTRGEMADGKWHSRHSDAHGWFHSSSG